MTLSIESIIVYYDNTYYGEFNNDRYIITEEYKNGEMAEIIWYRCELLDEKTKKPTGDIREFNSKFVIEVRKKKEV